MSAAVPSEERPGPPPPEAGHIGVFAPSLMYTVTIEHAPHGADEVLFHAGGQGFWIARMIKSLGERPLLCGPLGGETGRLLRAMITDEGVEAAPVAVREWNGGYVHDRRSGRRIEIARTPSPRLNRHEVDDLYGAALAIGLSGGVVVLTGSAGETQLPTDFLPRLARDLAQNGVAVIADVSRGSVEAMDGGVRFLKVSDEDLLPEDRREKASEADLREAVARLRRQGCENLVISRAEKPAVAFIDGCALEIMPPRFEELDHRGAGDSMTAALAVAVRRGLDAEATLRLAAAAGAVNVTRRGLGTGAFADIELVARSVKIRELGWG